MFSIRYICCAAALLAAVPVTASAATIDFMVITGQPGNNSRSWQGTVDGQFTDYALFSTTTTDNFSASITNSYGSADQFIDGLTLTLYKGATVGSGTKVSTNVSMDSNSPPGTQSVDLLAFRQVAGSYYLQISGMSQGSTSYGGSLGVSIAPVPLPASAPMLGAGLIALGAAGYAAKRKRAAAT